jgi:RNA polymerase sigma factor (sigma-70 family)
VDFSELEARWAGWMREGLAGSERAYRDLLQELTPRIRMQARRQVMRYGASVGDAEDIVQETLLAIHLKRHTWKSSELFTPWVAAICRNKATDLLRRRGRREEVSLDLIEEPMDLSAENEAAVEDVSRVLERLDDRARKIVQGIAIEGRSAREVAEVLRMSEGAVRVALHRGLKSLAMNLRQKGEL